MAVLIVGKHPFLPTIAISFIASYAAMWLTLALDAATVKYNRLYEKITENPGTEESTGQDDHTHSGEDHIQADPHDEVPQM